MQRQRRERTLTNAYNVFPTSMIATLREIMVHRSWTFKKKEMASEGLEIESKK
jgi:hypothetical protein